MERNKHMFIVRLGDCWEVSTWWDTGIRRMHLSTVHVHQIENLIGCVARVADRPDYIIHIEAL